MTTYYRMKKMLTIKTKSSINNEQSQVDGDSCSRPNNHCKIGFVGACISHFFKKIILYIFLS